MPAAAFIPAIIGAGASIGAGAIAAHANTSAAKAAGAANTTAAGIEAKTAADALAAEKEQQDYERWLTSATAEARQPYMDAIAAALGTGAQGAGFSASSWSPTPYEAAKPFEAPTMDEATADPGYQFALKEGQKALERSAAAKGTILTGGTLKDLTAYGQGMASQQYDKVLARDEGIYNTNEANRANAWSMNTNASYQAEALGQQGRYQSASLALDAYGKQLSSLFSLAGLAAPGAYPGITRTPTGWQPGMQQSGGGVDPEVAKVLPIAPGGHDPYAAPGSMYDPYTGIDANYSYGLYPAS